jgi:large repetitive protein
MVLLQLTLQADYHLILRTYQLTITDSKGCTLDTSANIGSIPAPQITGINTTSPLCFGNATGSATVVFTGGTSPSPQWGPNANNQTTITAVGLTAGNYCVTVTDLNGCSVSQCAAITQPSKLSGVPDKDQTICFGNSTQIWGSGSGGTQPYTITWTNASFTGSGPHTINPTQTTSYCFNIKDNNNCSADTCINITVTPELIASVTPGTTINICNGDTTQICVNTSGGNGNIITYTWSNNYTDSSYTGSCQQVSPSANST